MVSIIHNDARVWNAAWEAGYFGKTISNELLTREYKGLFSEVSRYSPDKALLANAPRTLEH